MSTNNPWFDLSYLKQGNPRQQVAYHTLYNAQIMFNFAEFDPVLTGTIPINIDIGTSDLDIICEVQNHEHFQNTARFHCWQYGGYALRKTYVDDLPTTIINFRINDFEIEIFGHDRPVTEQNAYRHMIVQSRLLAIGGDKMRAKIRQLKTRGLKTEPAFAKYFGITTDPYQTMLDWYTWDDTALQSLWDQRR